jgi:hypothetical protein
MSLSCNNSSLLAAARYAHFRCSCDTCSPGDLGAILRRRRWVEVSALLRVLPRVRDAIAALGAAASACWVEVFSVCGVRCLRI